MFEFLHNVRKFAIRGFSELQVHGQTGRDGRLAVKNSECVFWEEPTKASLVPYREHSRFLIENEFYILADLSTANRPTCQFASDT